MLVPSFWGGFGALLLRLSTFGRRSRKDDDWELGQRHGEVVTAVTYECEDFGGFTSWTACSSSQ